MKSTFTGFPSRRMNFFRLERITSLPLTFKPGLRVLRVPLANRRARDTLVVARVIRAEDGFGATACDLVKKTLKSRAGPNRRNPDPMSPRSQRVAGAFCIRKESA